MKNFAFDIKWNIISLSTFAATFINARLNYFADAGDQKRTLYDSVEDHKIN